MSNLFVSLQGVAVLAVLAGVALLLPLGGALVVDGVLVLVLSTALEVVRLRARSAPSDRRSRTEKTGVQ